MAQTATSVAGVQVALRDSLDNLNLEPIVIKSMDKLEGEGWSFEYAQSVEREYRRFLTLCREYPEKPVVPSSIVDKMWHLHILDTRKYSEDCERFLGFFLHHFPYFGMRGEDDAANLDKAWDDTRELYAKHFDDNPRDEFWPESVRCPNCGRRSSTRVMSEERPSYKSYGLK